MTDLTIEPLGDVVRVIPNTALGRLFVYENGTMEPGIPIVIEADRLPRMKSLAASLGVTVETREQ